MKWELSEEFDDEYNNNLIKLRYAAKCGLVAKGLRETLRAIRSNTAKIVYLAVDCDIKDYKNVIEESCELFKVDIVEINDWKELRDSVMDCIPSDIRLDKFRRKGKTPKITQKCFVAAILSFGDIERKIKKYNPIN